MSIKYDTHLHTSFSPDSNTSLSEQIDQAKSLGLNGICITDHIDYDFPIDQCSGYDENPFIFDVNSYLNELKLATNKNDDIEIMKGVEIGLQTDIEVINKNKELIMNNSFDEVIGSIHLIDKKDPYYPEFWVGNDHKNIIKRYFEITMENLNSFSGFDILGHLDYATRYLPKGLDYNPSEYIDIIDDILTFLINHEIAMEINTSGIKKGYGLTNPHPDIIKRYYTLGGRLITIGSDAHSPDAMAFGFDTLADELISYGFKEYAIFKNRKPNLLPL